MPHIQAGPRRMNHHMSLTVLVCFSTLPLLDAERKEPSIRITMYFGGERIVRHMHYHYPLQGDGLS